MAVKPIALSFKNTPEDMDLYKWIISHSNMSGFIKDILRREMNGEVGAKETKGVHQIKETGLIDMNF